MEGHANGYRMELTDIDLEAILKARRRQRDSSTCASRSDGWKMMDT
jgi:hypothetical protein